MGVVDWIWLSTAVVLLATVCVYAKALRFLMSELMATLNAVSRVGRLTVLIADLEPAIRRLESRLGDVGRR